LYNPSSPKPIKKCPEIKTLKSYSENPPPNFWKTFPKKPTPTSKQTKIKCHKFQILISKYWDKFSLSEQKTASKALETLNFGAKPKLTRLLPTLFCKNANSTYKNGESLTDTVAHWIKEDFVAGPFEKAPLKNFRVNPLMTIEQKNKIRPVLNLSSPKHILQ